MYIINTIEYVASVQSRTQKDKGNTSPYATVLDKINSNISPKESGISVPDCQIVMKRIYSFSQLDESIDGYIVWIYLRP